MAWKPDYASASDLKASLRISDAVDDAELARWVTTASRAVDAHCNRQFGQLAAPAARTYRRPVAYDYAVELWLLEIDDVQDVTGMTVGGVAYATSGAVLLPDNAPADGRPWERLGFVDPPTLPLVVVARWGWAAVPTPVVSATLLQAARFHARRDAPFGVAGSPEAGSEMRLLARLDPDVAVSLGTGMSRRRRVA